MNLNPHHSKQTQEVLFNRKIQKVLHPKSLFKNADVSLTNSQKHFRVVLDFKLTFHDHLDIVFTKVRKTIGILRTLNSILPRAPLATIFKTFVRPHLDYGDVLYNQAFYSTFRNTLESIQYNAFLAITEAISSTSREKLYQS